MYFFLETVVPEFWQHWKSTTGWEQTTQGSHAWDHAWSQKNFPTLWEHLNILLQVSPPSQAKEVAIGDRAFSETVPQL